MSDLKKLKIYSEVELCFVFKVFMGDNDAEKLAKLTPLGVASLHPHPEYKNPDNANYNHDIALIKLQQPLTFHADIMPLCLPPEDAIYETAKIGWVRLVLFFIKNEKAEQQY